MSRPSIVLVGCGAWGRYILRDLKELGAHVTVVARSSTSIERARVGGADLIVDAISRVEQAFDGAVVASPTATHLPVIEELASAGVPIFVEKPLALDLPSARQIVEIAGDRVFVMDKWRYHSGIERLRQIAVGSELGSVIGLRATRCNWSLSHDEIDPSWVLLPHDLAITYHILGHIPPVRWAVGDPLGPATGGLLAELADADGPRVVIEVSGHHPLYRRAVTLACSEGTASLDGADDTALVVRRGKTGDRRASEERWPCPGPMPLWAELKAFLEYLGGGAPPMSNAKEAMLGVTRLVEIRTLAQAV
jgi:predicted dehydrogenase